MSQSEEIPPEPEPAPAPAAQNTEPAQPVEPAQPEQTAAQTAEPTQAAEVAPAEAAEPTQLVQPAQPVEPAEPTQPIQPAAQNTEPTQPIQPVAAPQPEVPTQPVPTFESAQPPAAPQPPAEPAPAWVQPAPAVPGQAGFGAGPGFAAPGFAAPAAPGAPGQAGFAAVPGFAGVLGVPVPSPEEFAAAEAAAAKKAKRRMVFAKSAVLAVPALILAGLMVVTAIEANSFSTKNTAASTAAKSGNVAGGLVAPLRAAQSAAQSSILVDAGCVAAEGKTTAGLESKEAADYNSLTAAENGTSISAVANAVNQLTDDVQALQTDLQQDAVLSGRASVKSAITAVTNDLGVIINTLQDELDGEFTDTTANNFNAAATRIDADSTAVDTMCGGTTLEGAPIASTGGNGTTNA